MARIAAPDTFVFRAPSKTPLATATASSAQVTTSQRPGDTFVRSSNSLSWLGAANDTQPNLRAAIDRLKQIESDLNARHDNRAVFATIYRMQTETTAKALQQPGRFEDPAFMTKLALQFVQFYIDAYDNYEAGNRAAVPEAWLHAFDLATQTKTTVMEDIALGINAHIGYDLPRALAVVGAKAGPQLRDFEQYNQILAQNIDPVKNQIIDRYTKKTFKFNLLHLADKATFGLDNKMSEEIFKLARGDAWQNGQDLEAGDRQTLSDMNEDSMNLVKGIEWDAKYNPLHAAMASARIF